MGELEIALSEEIKLTPRARPMQALRRMKIIFGTARPPAADLTWTANEFLLCAGLVSELHYDNLLAWKIQADYGEGLQYRDKNRTYYLPSGDSPRGQRCLFSAQSRAEKKNSSSSCPALVK
jgi:hypothetical protein